MSEDRDDHLYTVGILILAIALMMFIENKSSCSFPAVQTMLGLLTWLTVYHANFLRKRRKARFSSNSNEEENRGKNDDGRLYTIAILLVVLALMIFFTENKSSCSFPALNTVLALLSGLFSYHAVSLEMGHPLTITKKYRVRDGGATISWTVYNKPRDCPHPPIYLFYISIRSGISPSYGEQILPEFCRSPRRIPANQRRHFPPASPR